MRIEYDDDVLTIIEKVNVELLKYELKFTYGIDECDGYELFELEKISELYKIIINAGIVIINDKHMSYDDLVRKAYPGIKDTYGFTIVVSNRDNTDFSVVPGEIVGIKDEMIFSIVQTNNA